MSAEGPCQDCKREKSEAFWARLLPFLNFIKWPVWIGAALIATKAVYTLRQNPQHFSDIQEEVADGVTSSFSAAASSVRNAFVEALDPVAQLLMHSTFFALGGIGIALVANFFHQARPNSERS
ncbi:MAG: hypothetical protein AAB439_03385 [Patescibacteria group bacterium]